MEMAETEEIGTVRSAVCTPGARKPLWVVVERIALKKPTDVAPNALFRRKRKDAERGVIGIREDAAWGRCLDLKIWRSTTKASPGVWIAVGDGENVTRFHLTPNEHALTFIDWLDKGKAPHRFVYRIHVFFSEHYASCYLEGKNSGKGRDGDI